MDLELIKNKVQELLLKENIEVVSVKTKSEFGMSILEIIVDGPTLDAAKLGEYNQRINDLIDEHLPANFYLEVSTAGAIRPINSLQEANKHIGKYVLAVTDRGKFQGELTKVDAKNIFVKVNLKGRFKEIEIPYKDISKFELTVKF